jgi:hypothetical protein
LKKVAYGLGVHADQYGRSVEQHRPQPGQPYGELK